MPDLWKQSTNDLELSLHAREIDNYRRRDAGSRSLQPQTEDAMARDETTARDETERYRQAAEDALQQLDWCIGYLHGIKKTKISTQLAKNRTHIKRNLMKQSAEPMPSETTDET
jgi:hypothetical protein